MKRLAKKVERERIVLSAMPELSVQIVEYASHHGRVTIAIELLDVWVRGEAE